MLGIQTCLASRGTVKARVDIVRDGPFRDLDSYVSREKHACL